MVNEKRIAICCSFNDVEWRLLSDDDDDNYNNNNDKSNQNKDTYAYSCRISCLWQFMGKASQPLHCYLFSSQGEAA